MRPALVGGGRSSIVNLIDSQKILKSGLQHGAVYFSCWVSPAGSTHLNFIWGETAGADALRQEMKLKLKQSYFIPAVWHHHNVYGYFSGTAMFFAADGKPHLRVYANQEKSDLESGKDFIAPQPIYLPTHKYEPYIPYPHGSWATEEHPGVVELEIAVDGAGQLKSARVTNEDPKGQGYGEHALKLAHNVTFMPAFRDGRAVESTTHPTLLYIPGNYSWRAKF